jgi:hypothetical protein
MKKLPLFFCLLLFACSSQKQVATDTKSFSRYSMPFHIYAIGKWNSQYVILTLVDARNLYFTVKGSYNAALKKGDIYNPQNQ